jgi:hypothetical protein
MKQRIIQFLNKYLYRLGYTLKPTNLPYLHDVVCSGNLEADLSTTLTQFFGYLHGLHVSDKTRSEIRLALAKVIEKHIISGQQNDSMYKIICNTTNNQPYTINEHQLLVDIDTGDKHMIFTLRGNRVTI